jgi:primosomal protein N' (replication factor Y)
MPAYCEIALPVPLDRVFTYAVCAGQQPRRGARVIVPFRNEKLIGVVTALHAKLPADFEARYIEAVLDEEPLLSDRLLALAEWMAQYYLAPLGEVLRGMLPLMAEVKRTVYYRITDLGRDMLAAAVEDEAQGQFSAGAKQDAEQNVVLKGHDFSRVSMVLRPTQVDENACAASAPEGPKENSPGPGSPRTGLRSRGGGQAKRSPGKGQQKAESPVGATEISPQILKGIGSVFDRAVSTAETTWALAPEGCFPPKLPESGLFPQQQRTGPRTNAKRRNRISAEEQDLERRVLASLAAGEAVKVSSLRTATAATLPVLAAMTRKKWIARETSAVERDARRMERFAVLIPEARLPALTAKQQAILAELAACGNELPLAELRRKALPSSTLQTLVRRGLVRIEARPAAFRLGGLRPESGPFRLNETQTEALASIATALGGFHAFLLHGVTGSGKTAVYLAAMQRALDRGEGSILLVPEIGLTPQTVGLLDAAFGQKVALLHSALTPEERSEQWRRIRRGEAPIVVGTRSAVFAPVPHLGLIVVDEEHDQSYKQEETPRYNARDVAVVRAKLEGAVVVMGSATPSLESWQNSVAGKYQRIEMRQRVMNRPLPAMELVDMRQEFQETGSEQLFSRALVEQTQLALDRGEQALILLNRRGYSFAVICRACGEKLECENCAIALTHHKRSAEDAIVAREGQRLECHYCGFQRTVPAKCPKCGSEHLYFLGAGSEQGEERLGEIFPGARIGRMDRDTVRGRQDMERLLARLHSGEINLLVGTQMIAKGHDIHGVTLVGVVGCDNSLSMPDFRSAERVFQLITQVSGRAGRGELPGRVVVQTYYPDHYAVVAASHSDYASFVAQELKFRRWMHYPPFGVLANVLVQSEKLEEAAGWASLLGKYLVQSQSSGAVRVLGPCTAPIARIKRAYRFHMILKSASRRALNAALRGMLSYADSAQVPRRNLIVDVDALRLM